MHPINWLLKYVCELSIIAKLVKVCVEDLFQKLNPPFVEVYVDWKFVKSVEPLLRVFPYEINNPFTVEISVGIV